MAETLANLVERAIELMRYAATDRLPVDVGVTAQIADVVRYAYDAGKLDTAQVARSAVEEYLNAQKDFLGDAELGLLREAFAEVTEAIK